MKSARRRIPQRWLFGAALACASTVTAQAEVIRINIDKLAFSPAQLSAHIGDTIEWSNADFVAHTATAKNQDWDVMIPAGKTARITVDHAGTVDFYCRFHPNMTGQINVIAK